jgi:hypothetical protein
MARCPDCGGEARSGIVHGRLCFHYDLRESLPDHLRQRFSFGTTPDAGPLHLSGSL